MRGYTILELLIVIAILTTLATLVFLSFGPFRQTTQLSAAVEDAVSLLVEARSKTLSSDGGSQYGVHFEIGKVVFFVGTTYVSGNPQNKEILLPGDIEISAILLSGGGVNVVFKRLTGATDQDGSITMRSKSNTNRTKIIRVEKTGALYGG